MDVCVSARIKCMCYSKILLPAFSLSFTLLRMVGVSQTSKATSVWFREFVKPISTKKGRAKQTSKTKQEKRVERTRGDERQPTHNYEMRREGRTASEQEIDKQNWLASANFIKLNQDVNAAICIQSFTFPSFTVDFVLNLFLSSTFPKSRNPNFFLLHHPFLKCDVT